MPDLTAEDLANIDLERTLNLVQKHRSGVKLHPEDRRKVEAWLEEQRAKAASTESSVLAREALASIIRVIAETALEVPIKKEGDLCVLRAKTKDDAEMRRIVDQANAAKLRVRWLNESTLVCIAVPKPAVA